MKNWERLRTELESKSDFRRKMENWRESRES